MDVELRTIPPRRVAYVTYEGPLRTVGKAFERLQAWVIGHKEPAAPVIGVYHDPPLDPDTPTTAEAWIPFDKAVGPDDVPKLGLGRDPVQIKTVPETKAAVCHYEGPPEEVPRFQTALRRFLEQQGMEPTGEVRHVYPGTGPGGAGETDEEGAGAWGLDVEIPVR